MKTAYALLWIGWILAFLAIELTALFAGYPQFTLSEFVWRLEQINGTWTFLRFFIMVFCIWLTFHMAFGWFK